MKDSCCISIIIDDEHSENLSISRLDNINKICDDLVIKYCLNKEIKDILVQKIKAYVSATRKIEKNLNYKAKEIIDRLYHKDLQYKRNKSIQNEKIKKKMCEDEYNMLTFSPKISVKSENLERKKSVNKYNKNQREKANIQIQRLFKYINEVEECKQHKVDNNNLHKYKSKNNSPKSSLKFIDRDLKSEIQGELFIPNMKYQNSFNNDLNLHLNNTDYRKLGLDCTTSRFLPSKDSYAEIYKNQINFLNSVNNSTASVRSRPLSKSLSTRVKTMKEGNISKNKSNDNLCLIKESNDSNSNIALPSKNTKNEAYSFSTFLCNNNINPINKETIEVNSKEEEKVEEVKPIIDQEKLNNEIREKKKKLCEAKLKEIDDKMPTGFKKLFEEEKITKMKKENKTQRIIQLESVFKPIINKKSKELCLNQKNRNSNCISRLFSNTQKKRKLSEPNNSQFTKTQSLATFTIQQKSKKLNERILSSPSNSVIHKKSSSSIKTEKKCSNEVSIASYDKTRIRDIKNEQELINNCKKQSLKRGQLRRNSLERCEKHLNHYRLKNFKSIYEKIEKSNNSEEGFNIEKIEIDKEVKDKLVIPVLHILEARNLEFNFQNFYILCNELLSYVEKENSVL